MVARIILLVVTVGLLVVTVTVGLSWSSSAKWLITAVTVLLLACSVGLTLRDRRRSSGS